MRIREKQMDKTTIFEHDSQEDMGVRLSVSQAATFPFDVRFEVNVDGRVLAAYIGRKGQLQLIQALAENLKEPHPSVH